MIKTKRLQIVLEVPEDFHGAPGAQTSLHLLVRRMLHVAIEEAGKFDNHDHDAFVTDMERIANSARIEEIG